ncbi:hypothetical protein HZ996_08680 [Cryomorphaceae bacterium]|nr:hypothetical protein HZ996_08680 [Cryomorphaceae bacterium]
MKKFSRQIIVLFGILSMSFVVVSWFVPPTETEDRAKNWEEPYNIITLGTSHGDDFTFGSIAGSGANFNLSANTLYYDLQQFNYVHEQGALAPKAWVLIPVSYFVFGTDENRTLLMRPGVFVSQFYAYMDPDQILDYSFRQDVSLVITRVQDFARESVNQMLGYIEEDVDTLNPGEFEGLVYAEHVERVEADLKARVKRHRKLGSYLPPQKNKAYLTKLVEEVRRLGYQPVVLTLPYYYSYNEGMGEKWLSKHYWKPLTEVVESTEVPWLDYSTDTSYTLHPELFLDQDHLNDAGRIQFTQKVYEDLLLRNEEP